MRKLSEFSRFEDIPINEDIEMDVKIPYGTKPSLLDCLMQTANKYGGEVVQMNTMNNPSYFPVFRIFVPEENIPKKEEKATETFFDRLVKEREELVIRIEKLEAFLQSDKSATIDHLQVSLLNIQLQAMKTYQYCLSTRLDLLISGKKE